MPAQPTHWSGPGLALKAKLIIKVATSPFRAAGKAMSIASILFAEALDLAEFEGVEEFLVVFFISISFRPASGGSPGGLFNGWLVVAISYTHLP